MAMFDFRADVPTDTCTKTYADYRSYKIPWLKNDYFERCGYCNDHDAWSNGRRGMQIDHFVPKAKFAGLFDVHNYSNLVYSCFYCNNNKSDDWVTTDPFQPVAVDGKSGYIHPRDKNYDAAFKRLSDGSIVPQNNIGQYMFKVLCLGLKRHRLIYHLEKLLDLIVDLKKEIADLNTSTADRLLLKEKLSEIAVEFVDYYQDYRGTLNN
jgi:5-methylcytosine-specific restriction endonuclease McrA